MNKREKISKIFHCENKINIEIFKIKKLNYDFNIIIYYKNFTKFDI